MSPARRKPATSAPPPPPAPATPVPEPPSPAAAAESPGPATTAAAALPDGTETCPWCSAKVPAGVATCPSCGASLRDAAEGEILGVTQIDPAAVSRASRIRPGRLATWLGADNAEETEVGGTVEPPSREVREEMLRLELAAIDAEIEAKKQAAEAQKLLPDEEAREAESS
jgi:hypothetical protein